MNVTQFKKDIKGITSAKKKRKAVEHEEYILSGTSDAVAYNSVIVVVPSFHKRFEIVTYRNKPFAYIVDSLEQLKDQDILKQVAKVYGVNFLFTMDKKQVCTFTRLSEKHIPEVEYKYFVDVTCELANYEAQKKHLTELLISEFGEITKDNVEQLKQISDERGYSIEMNKAYSRYREKFNIFLNTYGYNPFSYNLKIK